MTEEAAGTPEEGQSKGGGALKTVLIVVIAILLVGVAGGIYFMMPEKVIEPKTYQWPPEGEEALEVSATLHDQSAVLLTSVRFETVPCNLEDLQEAIKKEFEAKKSVIESIMTEVAIGLDSELASDSSEFRRQVTRRINEELTVTEVDRILIINWMLPPTE
jgi:flagellar basal body-associated protein FliL